MGLLEKFLHDDPVRTPPLLKAALAHVQFETIHPFLDGNGRVGRLLITLLLCAEGILREPLLYLSLYFREHREEYFRLLEIVRRDGDWERWLAFFANAVDTTAGQAVETARKLGILFQTDRGRIEAIGRGAGSALRVHHELQRRPLATVSWLRSRTKISTPTIGKAMDTLSKIGVVHEVTGHKRNRVFAYSEYLKLIE
jgi:Fic family protein